MRTSTVALRFVVTTALIVGLVAGAGAASYRAGLKARCATGDMTASLTPEDVKVVRGAGFAWLRRALTCKVGDYQFVTANKAGQDGFYVIQRGRMFLGVNEKETDLFDESGKHLVFSLTRPTADRASTISYSAYDAATGAWIENFDLGADGSLDYRTTEINGRRVKQEFRVGDQWLEMVQREGHDGVVFDGRFMPVSDAITLANAAGRR